MDQKHQGINFKPNLDLGSEKTSELISNQTWILDKKTPKNQFQTKLLNLSRNSFDPHLEIHNRELLIPKMVPNDPYPFCHNEGQYLPMA